MRQTPPADAADAIAIGITHFQALDAARAQKNKSFDDLDSNSSRRTLESCERSRLNENRSKFSGWAASSIEKALGPAEQACRRISGGHRERKASASRARAGLYDWPNPRSIQPSQPASSPSSRFRDQSRADKPPGTAPVNSSPIRSSILNAADETFTATCGFWKTSSSSRAASLEWKAVAGRDSRVSGSAPKKSPRSASESDAG